MNETDLMEYLKRQRPDSKCRAEYLTNLTNFKLVIFKSNYLFGDGETQLPEYIFYFSKNDFGPEGQNVPALTNKSSKAIVKVIKYKTTLWHYQVGTEVLVTCVELSCWNGKIEANGTLSTKFVVRNVRISLELIVWYVINDWY